MNNQLQYNVTYRQKDKGWQYIISYKKDNKWKQTSKQGFRTKGLARIQADKKLEDMKDYLEFQEKVPSEYIEITFKEFMDMYIKHKEVHREYSTIRSINGAWNKFSSLNDLEVKDINSVHAQSCVDGIIKEDLSHNTLITYIALMNGAFNYAIERNILRDNPLNKISIPEDKGSKTIRALDKTELDDLLDKIKNRRYKMIAMIAGTCGLRISEIIGLTWDSINFEKSTITVEKQWKEIKKGKWDFGKVKRKASNRVVPIPPSSLKELIEYKSDIPIHFSNRIFYQNVSTKSLGQNISDAFKRVGYNITVHELRHTYATLLIANGVDFKTVAKLMGHDVEQTIKTYSHVTDDMMSNATNTLNIIFN